MRRCLALALLFPLAASATAPLQIGSKAFTESVILGEMITQLSRSARVEAVHRQDLGGSQVLWKALLRGEVDAYPEYTGTLWRELFKLDGDVSLEKIRRLLDENGVAMSRPLGFDNTYAVGMLRKRATALGIRRISDLAKHPELQFGFDLEFLERVEGWPLVKRRYGIKPRGDVRGLEHNVAYRALAQGSVDVSDLWGTDAEIKYYDLVLLEDDRKVFPAYQGVILYRKDLTSRAPAFVEAALRLEGRLPQEKMIALNERAKLRRVPEDEVASTFLHDELGVGADVASLSFWSHRFWGDTRRHLSLVFLSLLATILVAVPLGIVASKRPRLGEAILGIAGVVQTVPSLALLVFMIPLLGIGYWPAVVALFLYGMLPILRNTVTGFQSIPPTLLEAQLVLGLRPATQLFRIELPLASRSILAGIKTTAVLNVGMATLGAIIGAGGYGEPIMIGIRKDDISVILQGAIPAAALALVIQWLFGKVEERLVPKGLRYA